MFHPTQGRRRVVPALLFLLAACPGLASAGDGRLAAQRLTFTAAEAALQRNDIVLYDRLKAQLKDYPLYPYLLYQDLKRRLDHNPAGEVQWFLDAYADAPVAGRLRDAWLRHLAATRQWQAYRRFYRSGGTLEQDCWRRQALLAAGNSAAALEDIEAVWLRGTSAPNACDPLFDLWRRQGGITAQRVWQRFHLALEKGQRRLARYLQGLLPPADRATAELWLAVDENPRTTVTGQLFDPDDPLTPTLLLHGLSRWSRADSVSAAAALDGLKERYRFSPIELAPLERRLALYLAGRGHPQADARLSALPTDQVDTAVREWRIRTALQAADWRTTLNRLDALPADEADTPQWQYWRARALEALGRTAEARPIYQRLAQQRDYHGFLAADRLGVPYQLGHAPLALAPEQLAALERLPGVRRARELFLLNRLWEARSEWRQVIDKLPAEDLQKAAKLAQQWGWHDQAIATLARAGYWDDVELRFPLAHRDAVLASARLENLDPAWIFAVIRQESIFQPDARSHAGALGLMQLLPATGRRVARELQLSLGGSASLLRTDTNIRLGARYLRHTLDSLQGNPLLATAAYNAGPNAVARWLPAAGSMEADLWAETVPYQETRNYIKKVMEYRVVYSQRLKQPGNTLKALMPPVRAAGLSSPP